jgi:uncharacterized membrane protein YbhN (UPF0104 family)
MRFPRIPAWLGHLSKVMVAVAVLWFMFRSGKIHPEVIGSAAGQWPQLLLVVAILAGQICITAVRWNLLLAGQGFRLATRQALSLTMIGTLFSTVIPGSVSGDLVKAYYVTREVNGRRSLAVATILMDRIVGLVCLATVAFLGVVWNRGLVFANHTLTVLSLAALAGCVAGIAGLAAAVFASGFLLRLANGLPAGLPLRHLAVKLSEVLASYQGHGGLLLAAFVLSIPVHAMGCLGMLVCLNAVGGSSSMPAQLLLFAFPLGMLAVSIPITPAGIGVGQAAFYAVCNMAMPDSGSAGANAFTVYQALAIAVYLLGLIPYLASRSRLVPAADAAGAEAGN